MTLMNDLIKERDDLERERIRLNTEVANIKSQLTAYICGNAKKRTNEWYVSANVALNSKKSQLTRVGKQIDDLSRKIKDQRKEVKDMRIRYTNEIFYHKVKEVMSAEDFSEFISSLDETIKNMENR